MSNVHYDSHSPYMSFNEDDLFAIKVILTAWYDDHKEMRDDRKYKTTTEYLQRSETLIKFIQDGLDEIEDKHK